MTRHPAFKTVACPGCDFLQRMPPLPPGGKARCSISIVWIIPILVAVVAIGIAIQHVMTDGPTITIVFAAAEGTEAGT